MGSYLSAFGKPYVAVKRLQLPQVSLAIADD
jgi:hypothetical protein